MITQYKKTSVRLVVMMMMCIALLTGCSSLSGSGEQVTPSANSGNESVTPDQKPASDTKVSSFQTYFNLLGSSKQNLLDNLNENPDSIDEGGLEFKKTGIRVWFNADTNTVSQIFTQRTDLDFKGVRIGDTIGNFKTAFGEPVSDQNNDLHFRYENGYLSVNYDPQTNITYAVYLLREDF